MGVGYIIVVPEASEPVAVRLLTEAKEKPFHLGEIAKGNEKVVLGGLL
jgi:phosphoribosylaminoimidazole (AIR) synthetase